MSSGCRGHVRERQLEDPNVGYLWRGLLFLSMLHVVPKEAFAVCKLLLCKGKVSYLPQSYVNKPQEKYHIQAPEIRFSPCLMSTGWE